MLKFSGQLDIDDAVPPELLNYRNCAPWRTARTKDGKKTKRFYNPFTLKPKLAEADAPATTSVWVLAKQRMLKLLNTSFGVQPEGGMGVLLGVDQADGTTIGGSDLDSCYVDGKLTPWAAEIIGLFNSYAEISPSGTGVKIFFRYRTVERNALKAAAGDKSVLWRGAGTNGGGHSPGIEIYFDKRFFTVTGARFGDCQELPIVSVATIEWLRGIAAKLPRAPTKAKGKKANGVPDRSGMATSLLISLLLADADLPFEEGMKALASADDPLIVEWYEEQTGPAGDRHLQRHWNFAVKSAAEFRARDVSLRDSTLVPDDAGTFAGMSASEVIADICHVSRGDWWWSHRHAEPFTATGLSIALNGLHRQLTRGWKTPPRTFVAWLKANCTVTNYTRFVRRGGQPPICETELGAGDEAVNSWRPLPPVPEEILERIRREGPTAVRPWLTLTGDICNDNKEQVEHLLDWAAFVAMEPSLKPGWSVVLYSAMQGIGKDMWGHGLSRTLGPGAYTTIPRRTLERDFNTYLVKRLIQVSDLHTTTRGSLNGSDVYSTLKQVTSNFPMMIEVNPKHEPPVRCG